MPPKQQTKLAVGGNAFLADSKQQEEYERLADPIIPSPNGTVFRCDSEPEQRVSERTKQDYWAIDATRVLSPVTISDQGCTIQGDLKIAEVPCILFLSSRPVRDAFAEFLFHLQESTGDMRLENRILRITGVPVKRGNFQTWEAVEIEEVHLSKQDKLKDG